VSDALTVKQRLWTKIVPLHVRLGKAEGPGGILPRRADSARNVRFHIILEMRANTARRLKSCSRRIVRGERTWLLSGEGITRVPRDAMKLRLAAWRRCRCGRQLHSYEVLRRGCRLVYSFPQGFIPCFGAEALLPEGSVSVAMGQMKSVLLV
jgi:hypothetical protein